METQHEVANELFAKGYTEHTCCVGVRLTRHIKFCTCDDGTPK